MSTWDEGIRWGPHPVTTKCALPYSAIIAEFNHSDDAWTFVYYEAVPTIWAMTYGYCGA